LNPPAYQSTYEEDQLALFNSFINNDFFSLTYDFRRYYEITELGKSDGWFEKYREQTVKNFILNAESFLKDLNEPDWYNMHSGTDYENYLKESLSSEHLGDCTAFPTTCDRCLAEDYYGIPYTANWSKAEGAKAYREKYHPETRHPFIVWLLNKKKYVQAKTNYWSHKLLKRRIF
jgi:hypothetical protein